MSRAARILPTRFGPLLVVVADDAAADRPAPGPGAVVASGLRPLPEGDAGLLVEPGEDALLDYIAGAVADWDAGTDLAALDRVPVWFPSGGFRAQAWRALRGVAPGEVVSYRELAALAGNERAMRAAGSACATNPVAPFVPCHRVVRTGGGLGEYGYGPDCKAAMLQHEGAWP